MVDFFVYWNERLKRVRIHRADCVQLLRNMLTKEVHNGRLPVETFDEAWRIVRELKRSKPVLRGYGRVQCGICKPGLQSRQDKKAAPTGS
jgi:hypothetical protein